MTTVNVYLNFDGNCQEAFDFYKSVFGGEFQFSMKMKDMPGDNARKSSDDAERLAHISLPISKETMLLGSDWPKDYSSQFRKGNNFNVSVSTDSKESATKIFNALCEGGKITMPLEKVFWAELFGMVEDKFGVGWMVGFSGTLM